MDCIFDINDTNDMYTKTAFPIYEDGNMYTKTPNHIHVNHHIDKLKKRYIIDNDVQKDRKGNH
ncbi:hypothetical protein SAMN04487827_0925 [Prevotella sp. khp7]|nr:hypothetical protein SAMN04487827_0925 [Prevotella sp. khp7]